jgi:hypothetical protein
VVAVVCLGCVDDGSAKVDSGLVGQTEWSFLQITLARKESSSALR